MIESSPSDTAVNPQIHKAWRLVEDFKSLSKLLNWQTSKHEDWIKTSNGKYHNFIWIQSVHPLTFDRICSDFKVAIRDKVAYHVVNISYLAWLFLKSPPEFIIRKIEKNPNYKKRIALYDLSKTLIDKSPCLRLNDTNSRVFIEFEKFIKQRLGVEIENINQRHVLQSSPQLYNS
jgi:hypothetical protein